MRRTAAALPKRDTVKLIQKKYSPGAFAFGGAVFSLDQTPHLVSTYHAVRCCR